MLAAAGHMVRNRTQVFLLGTLAGAVLAFGVAVAAKRSDPQTPTPECPTATAVAACPPAESPSAAPTARPSAAASAAAGAVPENAAPLPLEVADPASVDAQELVPRAKAIALSQDKH